MSEKYLVTWKIDIDAESPTEAAFLALSMQRDKESCARYFTVFDKERMQEYEVDLGGDDEETDQILKDSYRKK